MDDDGGCGVEEEKDEGRSSRKVKKMRKREKGESSGTAITLIFSVDAKGEIDWR